MVKFEIITDNDGPNLLISKTKENLFMAEWILIRIIWDGNNWRLSAKHLPHDGQRIIVSDGKYIWMEVWQEDSDQYGAPVFQSGSEIENYTWWMPLPSLPSVEDGE